MGENDLQYPTINFRISFNNVCLIFSLCCFVRPLYNSQCFVLTFGYERDYECLYFNIGHENKFREIVFPPSIHSIKVEVLKSTIVFKYKCFLFTELQQYDYLNDIGSTCMLSLAYNYKDSFYQLPVFYVVLLFYLYNFFFCLHAIISVSLYFLLEFLLALLLLISQYCTVRVYCSIIVINIRLLLFNLCNLYKLWILYFIGRGGEGVGVDSNVYN